MVAHCVSDGIGLALRAGVIAAHQALQFGEFADHTGDKIGLAQAGCAFGIIGASALDDALLNQPARELCHAFNLVRNCPQLLMKGDLRQFLRLFVERDFQILFPEEFGIRKPCRQHLFIARNNRCAAIIGDDIGGADKGVGQFAGLVMADEIFLVHPRGQLDHLLRHFQKRRIEPAKHRHRPFGQARIFRDQTFILDQRQPGRFRCGRCAIANDRGALAIMDDHMGGTQCLNIGGGIGDFDRAGGMEPVAHCLTSTDDAVNLACHHIIAEQGNNALQWSHPAQAFGARRCCTPALRFRPGECADDRRDRFGQHIGGFATRLFNHSKIDAIAFNQLVFVQSGFTKKALHRLRRRADFGPFGFFRHRLCFQRQPLGNQGQPAGRGKGFDGFGGEAGLGECFGEKADQIVLGLCLHPRGDFFAAKF